MTRTSNNIRRWLIGKSYYSFIAAHENIDRFMHHFDIKDRDLSIFRSNAPDTLSDASRTAILRMYVYIRDQLNGGYGFREAVRLSSFTTDTLCDLGILEKEEVESDEETERLLTKIVRNVFRFGQDTSDNCICRFYPAANSLCYVSSTGEEITAFLDPYNMIVELFRNGTECLKTSCSAALRLVA